MIEISIGDDTEREGKGDDSHESEPKDNLLPSAPQPERVTVHESTLNVGEPSLHDVKLTWKLNGVTGPRDVSGDLGHAGAEDIRFCWRDLHTPNRIGCDERGQITADGRHRCEIALP